MELRLSIRDTPTGRPDLDSPSYVKSMIETSHHRDPYETSAHAFEIIIDDGYLAVSYKSKQNQVMILAELWETELNCKFGKGND